MQHVILLLWGAASAFLGRSAWLKILDTQILHTTVPQMHWLTNCVVWSTRWVDQRVMRRLTWFESFVSLRLCIRLVRSRTRLGTFVTASWNLTVGFRPIFVLLVRWAAALHLMLQILYWLERIQALSWRYQYLMSVQLLAKLSDVPFVLRDVWLVNLLDCWQIDTIRERVVAECETYLYLFDSCSCSKMMIHFGQIHQQCSWSFPVWPEGYCHQSQETSAGRSVGCDFGLSLAGFTAVDSYS